MILVEEKGERNSQLLVIRQTDHAFLAGFFAREWGNEKFIKPQPNASFCLSVAGGYTWLARRVRIVV